VEILRVVVAATLSRASHLFAVLLLFPTTAALAAPVVFQVKLGQASDSPVSGRLLVFARALDPLDKEAKAPARVDMDQIDTHATAIAAREVGHFDPGATIDLDADDTAFPTPFSQLERGRYAVQAVLDRDHGYNHTGRGPGDLVSEVVETDLPGEAPLLTLATAVPDPARPVSGKRAASDAASATSADIDAIEFASPALSRFWGRKVSLRGWVATPPGYSQHSDRHYPTVYFTNGFGGSLRTLHDTAVARLDEMKAGKAPPMIWVALDQSNPAGASEFVDSVNNGPWGEALTAELIPELERRYRMDARPSGRLLTGHSSGGWAALWLQVRYPRLFGGAWPTAPDPADFHDFLGIDLYAPGANVYRGPDGTARALARDKGKMLVSIEDFTRREVVVGEYGGQMTSFDWAFSPRGADGRPLPMFDRATGAVNADVIAYWKDHYDVAEYLRRHWSELKNDLDGKIHVTVGGSDTFFLDGAAHRLESAMKELGAKTDFRYVEGRGHFDLYRVGDDPWGLYKTIASEMYARARPQ
jgi:S-formylglutathione hydrolase FrmB